MSRGAGEELAGPRWREPAPAPDPHPDPNPDSDPAEPGPEERIAARRRRIAARLDAQRR